MMQNLFLAALVLAVFVYFEQMLISTMTIGSNPPILGGICLLYTSQRAVDFRILR